MPKSKRNKLVHLTKISSRGKVGKAANIERIQMLCDKFNTIYLFNYKNLRTNLIKELRSQLKDDSRIYMGKNSLVRRALGTSKDQAYRPGLEELAVNVRGNVGMLFTNKPASEIEAFIKSYRRDDYARAGSEVQETFELKKGLVGDIPGNMYEELRRLHFPVRLEKGRINLEQNHFLCKKGDTLTPEQAQSLKLFDKKFAQFEITLTHRWREGEVVSLISYETGSSYE